MSITISLPALTVIVLSTFSTVVLFSALSGSGDRYGIGAMFAFFISAFLVCFYVSVLFAGAYFNWWLI